MSRIQLDGFRKCAKRVPSLSGAKMSEAELVVYVGIWGALLRRVEVLENGPPVIPFLQILFAGV